MHVGPGEKQRESFRSMCGYCIRSAAGFLHSHLRCEQVYVHAALCVCVCVCEFVRQLQPHIAVALGYQRHIYCIPLSYLLHAPLFYLCWFASSLQDLSTQSRWMTGSLEEEGILVLLPVLYCISQQPCQSYRQKELCRSLKCTVNYPGSTHCPLSKKV